MSQPIPQVTAADVERLVRRDFAPADVTAALELLAAYGPKTWHNEPVRVRVALLRLSHGKLDLLRKHLAVAQTDYRDVLSMAEYPAYFTQVSPAHSDQATRDQATAADWAQYRHWFERP